MLRKIHSFLLLQAPTHQFYFYFAILILAEAQGSSLSKWVCVIFQFWFRLISIKVYKKHKLFDFKMS